MILYMRGCPWAVKIWTLVIALLSDVLAVHSSNPHRYSYVFAFVCICTLSSVMPSMAFAMSNRKKTTAYIMQSALYLTAVYTVLDVLLALPIAMWVAYRRGSLTDRAIMVATTVALSISFLVYVIIGQYVFGFQLGWFPVQGWSDSTLTNLLVYSPLPVLLAVAVGVAPQTRLYRSFFLDELGQDYVRTARAKGMTEGVVLFRHVLRNAMIPILTNIGLQLPGIFVGSFLIEVFFSIPGLGREVLLAVNRSDFPVIQAVSIYLAVLTMVINLLTDLAYKVADPRVVLK
jgi:peptide/nickel transport system permease protein